VRNNINGQLDNAITPGGIYKLVSAYSARWKKRRPWPRMKARAPPNSTIA
jgi:hypothetical protein